MLVSTVTWSSFAAAATFSRIVRSCSDTVRLPGVQIWVMRTPRKPARTSRSISAFAPASVGARTASSVAPSTSAGPPARAAGARTNAVARTTHRRRIVALIDLATVARAMEERVKGQLTTLPAKPGVYLFRDAKGDVLYVGKAKSLRPRVRSYFQKG